MLAILDATGGGGGVLFAQNAFTFSPLQLFPQSLGIVIRSASAESAAGLTSSKVLSTIVFPLLC